MKSRAHSVGGWGGGVGLPSSGLPWVPWCRTPPVLTHMLIKLHQTLSSPIVLLETMSPATSQKVETHIVTFSVQESPWRQRWENVTPTVVRSNQGLMRSMFFQTFLQFWPCLISWSEFHYVHLPWCFLCIISVIFPHKCYLLCAAGAGVPDVLTCAPITRGWAFNIITSQRDIS